jgi:CheY-like chemotaxis protein
MENWQGDRRPGHDFRGGKMAPLTDVGPLTHEPAQADGVPERPGILIVDDDPLLRMLLNLGLRHHGFHVWQAAGGREAVAVYRQYGSLIDLVLLDLRMPDLDGLQTMAALREIEHSVRVCFLCGSNEGGDPGELTARGAVGVLAKPFRLDGLVQALEHLVGRR